MTARVEIATPQIQVKYRHNPGLFIEPKMGRNILESRLSMENSSEQAGRSQSTEAAYTINIFTNTQSVNHKGNCQNHN